MGRGRIGETGQAGGQEGWRGKEEQKGLRVVAEVVAVCATTRRREIVVGGVVAVEERRAAVARRKQRYQRFPRAHMRRVPPKIPKSTRNKGLPLRSNPPLPPPPSTPPVTCTRYTRAHRPSMYEQRRRNMDFSRSDVLCALRRREHVHGPRVRFDEPR